MEGALHSGETEGGGEGEREEFTGSLGLDLALENQQGPQGKKQGEVLL